SWAVPESSLPTVTWLVGFRLPVAVMLRRMSPRRRGEVSKTGPSSFERRAWRYAYQAPPAARTATPIHSQRLKWLVLPSLTRAARSLPDSEDFMNGVAKGLPAAAKG